MTTITSTDTTSARQRQQRILTILGRADRIDFREGRVAYENYHTTLSKLAAHYGIPFEPTVAAFSALSPNNDYMSNLRSLATCLKAISEGVPLEHVKVTTYRACRNRAWQFLHGVDFLSTTKGPKTRNFFLNIVNPLDPYAVTIDGHMVGIWMEKRLRMVEVATAKFNYERVAEDFRRASNKAGLLPSQLQAILWFTWKRIHEVVYQPQLDLTKIGNEWGLRIEPEEVKPIPWITENARERVLPRVRPGAPMQGISTTLSLPLV